MEEITNRKMVKNVSLVLIVQIISSLVSFIIGFIVPKFISELTYSWWQIFMLYVNYSALFHFGILDGIILRYSQFNYDDLNHKEIRSQFVFMNLIELIIGIIVFGVVLFLDFESKFLVLLICVGIILKNLFRYTNYTFQTTNSIREYSISILIERITYVVMTIILLLLKNDQYEFFCVANLLGCIFGLIYGIIKRPKLYFGKFENLSSTAKNTFKTLSMGLCVTLAVFCSSFLVTGAKMIIQWKWDKLTFGQVSFSMSVMNIFLTFISAASIALFPSMKRMNKERYPDLYKQIRDVACIIMFIGILFYFPIKKLLLLWIPNYAEGLSYVGLILPSVIFSSKVNLLTNTYLKAYQRERTLLIINIFSVLIGIILFVLCGYVFKSLILMFICVDIVTLLNSIISEIVVSKLISKSFIKDIIADLAMAIAFFTIVYYLDSWTSLFTYLSILIVYLIFHRESLKNLFRTIKSKLFKRKKIIN